MAPDSSISVAARYSYPGSTRSEIHTGTPSRALPETRPRARLGVLQLLRLWRARRRHRQELMQMSARDLKDARVPRDLVEHEARKRPWQKWNSQWQELDRSCFAGSRADTHVETTIRLEIASSHNSLREGTGFEPSGPALMKGLSAVAD